MAEGDDAAHLRVDAGLKEWQQGDCILEPSWFVFRIDPQAPLTDDAKKASGDGADLVEQAVVGFVVVTQTCDIVRSSADRPWVEVSPLVEVDSKEMDLVRRGRRPQYAFIPGVSDQNLVAHLDRVMTVEKAVVGRAPRTQGCATDLDRRALSAALARKRSRVAFPDDFTELVGPLQRLVNDKHGKQEAGVALRALSEIRVRARPSWGSSNVELTFLFIRHHELETAPMTDDQWSEQKGRWMAKVKPTARYKPIYSMVVTLDGLTARDYVESDPLDLDHLSTRGG